MELRQSQSIPPPEPNQWKLEHDPNGAARGGTITPNAHDDRVQVGKAKMTA